MSNTIARLEGELRRLELEYGAVYRALIQAKTQAAKHAAEKIVAAGDRRRAQIVDLPTDPTARAIVLAGRKARNED
jgi:hypothetical protein